MADLMLHLKAKYWFEILEGTKTEEYRLDTPYWRKKLLGRDYDYVILCWGYPKANQDERKIVRKWRGVRHVAIRHEIWGNQQRLAWAIRL